MDNLFVPGVSEETWEEYLISCDGKRGILLLLGVSETDLECKRTGDDNVEDFPLDISKWGQGECPCLEGG